MRTWMRGLAGLVGGLALSGSTCTTTYTEADLVKEERKQDAAAVAEEKYDQELGEQGGANEEAIEEQIDSVEDDTGADY